MKPAASYFPCHRCGMRFLLAAPRERATQEKLVCSECGIAYGVAMSRGRGCHNLRPIVCWLIREGGARRLKGARKIA